MYCTGQDYRSNVTKVMDQSKESKIVVEEFVDNLLHYTFSFHARFLFKYFKQIQCNKNLSNYYMKN